MEATFTYSEQEVRELILHHYPRLISYIRKLLGRQSVVYDAEDIFQDALCQFVEKRAEITADKAAAYLFRIVRNRTLNCLTRSHIDKLSLHTDTRVMSAWDTLASLDYEGVEEERVKDIDMVDIEDIIAYSENFSPRMREIFYLSRIEGLTHREIAERLQISTRMVERYLQQSVIKYRTFFGINSTDSKSS